MPKGVKFICLNSLEIKMDAIQLSNKLQATGLERKSAEVIAQAIDERNQEASTKNDLKLMSASVDKSIKSVKELLYFVIAAGGAAFGYIITKI
jgi:hypothetical protein